MMLVYFFKINIAIALFYAFYRLFFYKDTFFAWRRAALLSFFFLSAICPLLNIQTWVTQQEPMAEMANLYANIMLPELQVTPTLDWKSLLLEYASILYWGTVILLSIRFLIQLITIIRISLRATKKKINGRTVYLLSHPGSPFSFFHWIFINPEVHSESEFNEILTHELTHARQWHSIDVIISEVACILCWFNPFIWLIRREIRTNLEYMADNHVLETGYDSKAYQYHLLGLAHHKAAATIYNSFNVLPLKKRIKMMNTKRTKKIGRTKYLMFLPLAALLMLISNIEAIAHTTKQVAKDVIESIEQSSSNESPTVTAIQKDGGIVADTQSDQQQKLVTYKGSVTDKDGTPLAGVEFSTEKGWKFSGTLPTSDKEGHFQFEAPATSQFIAVYKKGDKFTSAVFDGKSVQRNALHLVIDGKVWLNMPSKNPKDQPFRVVDQMPEFPGGMNALLKYLSANIKYPDAALKAGIQGRVVAQYIVNRDGSISDIKILRGVNPDIDKEAIRVINSMPKWKPGMQKGKVERVTYTIPIVFSLNNAKTNAKYESVPGKAETTLIADAPQEQNGSTVFEVVEDMPQFPGGKEGLMQYLAQNIKYPESAQKSGAQGRVIVQMIIDQKGNVTSPRVLQGVNPAIDAEAIRIVDTMPKWKPGKQRGKAVRVKYTLPIVFKLQ
jgi:TonB family protein